MKWINYYLNEKFPTLTIFVPELPKNSFSAALWNTDKEIPVVAVRTCISNDVPIYDKDGEEKIIKSDLIPMYPIVVLKDNETGNLLENKVVEDEEKITAFNQMCGGLKNPTDEKYSEAFFDSITSSEYTLNFSSSDFTETASDKGDAVIVECNGLSYELAVGGEEWQKIADFLDSISK